LNESQDFNEIRPGTHTEKRHTDFVDYLKKMGMKEYENGTVIFYEDETDIKPKPHNDESQLSIATSVADYDSDLIGEMFSQENQIRISRDHKENT